MNDIILLVIGVSIGAILWSMVGVRLSNARLLIAIMLFASSISISRSATGVLAYTWLQPIQELRAELFFGAGVILSLGLLTHIPRISVRQINGQAWLLLSLALYQGILRIYHDSVFLGISTLGGTLATLLPLMLVIPAILQIRQDYVALLRILGFSQLIWLAGTIIQFVVDPGQLSTGWHDRFVGLASNPQYTAVLLAITSVFFLWLVLNDDKRKYRWIWIVALGLNAVLVVATGSRTGGLMLVIGCVVCLHRRLGRAVLMLPLVVLAGWATVQLFQAGNLEFGYERFTSLENTRWEAWLTLLEQGMEHPMAGQGLLATQNSENSYLLAWAAFGIGMLLLAVVFTLASMAMCLRLWRISHVAPAFRPVIDLILAINGMYFIGAMLEGYMLARASPPLIAILVASGMAVTVTNRIGAGQTDFVDEAEDDAYDMSFDTASVESMPPPLAAH